MALLERSPADAPYSPDDFAGSLPTNEEMNTWLFSEPQPEQPRPPVRTRVWVSGIIVNDPIESPLQGQPFANWARSRLTYDIGPEDEPPAGYTGVKYETADSHYPPPRS